MYEDTPSTLNYLYCVHCHERENALGYAFSAVMQTLVSCRFISYLQFFKQIGSTNKEQRVYVIGKSGGMRLKSDPNQYNSV